jgi:hypothetical protein
MSYSIIPGSKRYLLDASQKIYGGKNKINSPFNAGDNLRQIWRLNEQYILEDGTEEYKFIGIKDEIMLLEISNKAAAFREDTMNPFMISENKKRGIWDEANPPIGEIVQLHFCYADRFKVI